jgi:hypothetical protein
MEPGDGRHPRPVVTPYDRDMPTSKHSRAILLAALLAASGCGDGFNGSSSDIPGGVEILTAAEDSGHVMQALSSFTLRYDAEQNCLYHDEPDNNGEPGTGGRVSIVWPFGFTAIADDNGVSVLDATGTPVARTGVTFQIDGGAVPAATDYCDVIGVWVAAGPPIVP